MTTFQFINLLLFNAAAWGLFGYFWSMWTYKVYKPFRWLDDLNAKRHSSEIIKTEWSFKDKNRFYSLWFLMKHIENQSIEGSIAELGVYKGETARVLHQMAPYRNLYLFDSFSGLPRQIIKEECDGVVRARTVDFSDTTPDKVLKLINGNSNVKIIEGVFPDTISQVPDCKYALVHIDADLYQSTIDALGYFYPRMSPGGVIVIHDYNHDWEGVVRAVDEFAAGIPESFVPLPDMYGSVVLTKNR